MKLPIFGILVLSGFLLWMIFHYDFSEAGKAFSSVDWWLIGLSFSFNIGLLYFRVFKWAIILKPMNRRITAYNICLATFSAYCFNMIIPAKAGGLIQAWIIGRKEKLSISSALASVALVRLLDGITLVFLGLLMIIWLKIPSRGDVYFSSFFHSAAMAGIFLLFMIVLFFFFMRKDSVINRFIRTLVRVIPACYKEKSEQAVKLFRDGLACLKSPWYLLAGFMLSLVFWLLCGISILIVLKAFGIVFSGIQLPYLILLAQVFSMSIPSFVNAGPYHAATIAVLSMSGVAEQAALYAAIVMHAVMLSSNTLPGFIYLCVDGAKDKRLIKEIMDAKNRFK